MLNADAIPYFYQPCPWRNVFHKLISTTISHPPTFQPSNNKKKQQFSYFQMLLALICVIFRRPQYILNLLHLSETLKRGQQTEYTRAIYKSLRCHHCNVVQTKDRAKSNIRHGKLNGFLLAKFTTNITWASEVRPVDSSLELGCLYPPDWVPQSPVYNWEHSIKYKTVQYILTVWMYYYKHCTACGTVFLSARHTASGLWPSHTLELLSNQSTATYCTSRYRPIRDLAFCCIE